VLKQAAQIYARQFSSLQSDLRTWDSGTCFFGSSDKYVHEFLICNMDTQ